MSEKLKLHSALFAVAFFFSLNYLISKLGMREFAPLTFAWMRVAGAAVILGVVARNEPQLSPEDSRSVAWWGILAVAINQSFFLGGLSLTTVPVAAILITTIPVFTLGAAIVAKQERATAPRVAGIALACVGALLVLGGETFHGTLRSFAGAVLIVFNCLSYSVYLVISKSAMARLSARRVVARMFAVGTAALLPVAAWPMAHEQWSQISPRAWLALVLVILGPSVGAYLLQAWALRYADSSIVASYVYVQPVLATLLGVLFLGEHLRAVVIAAAVLIFAGVWLATTPRVARVSS